MSLEFRNKQARRRWSPARRASDLARRVAARRKFEQYVPDPARPSQTIVLTVEEQLLVAHINATRQVWVKLWPTLNELAGRGHVSVTRPRRQALMALVQRMLSERKLVRHRKTNSIALAMALRTT